jgi:hypothetical protein
MHLPCPGSHPAGSLYHELFPDSLDMMALRSAENVVNNQEVRMMSEPKKIDDIGGRSHPTDKLNQAHP